MESLVYATLFAGLGKIYLRAENSCVNDTRQASAHFVRKYLQNEEAADLIDKSSNSNASLSLQLEIALQLSGLAEGYQSPIGAKRNPGGNYRRFN
jgi:hypothetical protein